MDGGGGGSASNGEINRLKDASVKAPDSANLTTPARSMT